MFYCAVYSVLNLVIVSEEIDMKCISDAIGMKIHLRLKVQTLRLFYDGVQTKPTCYEAEEVDAASNKYMCLTIYV